MIDIKQDLNGQGLDSEIKVFILKGTERGQTVSDAVCSERCSALSELCSGQS